MAERIVSGVKSRNLRRKRLVREAWGGAAAAALVTALVVPAVLRLDSARAPQMTAKRAAVAPAPPLVLSKVDHSVEVRWQGSKSGEYVVYRCTSPKFDQCSLADKVKGTKWIDASSESGIIYYRVEPVAGNGRQNG